MGRAEARRSRWRQGLSALGLGGDVGGSLRIPAQWNRILSLKATPGRIPSSESGLGLAAMTAFGPFGRSVEDLRLGYAALARTDPRDPWGVAAGMESRPRRARGRGPRRRRAAIDRRSTRPTPSRASAERCGPPRQASRSHGYELVDDVPPGLDDVPDLWARLFLTEIAAQWAELAPILSADCRRWLEDAFTARPPLTTAAELIEAYRERHALAAAWPQALILSPVMTIGAPAVGFDLQGPEALKSLFRAARFCWAANVLGRPAVAVRDVQLMGPRFGEALCLDAAELIG